jgi:hypothetical protein
MTNIDIDFRNQNNKERSELIEKLHEVYYSSEKEERIKILQKLNYLNDAKHFDQIEKVNQKNRFAIHTRNYISTAGESLASYSDCRFLNIEIV